MTYLFKQVYLDNSEIEVCKMLGRMRSEANNVEFKKSDFIGLLGECAYAKHFNLYLDLSMGKRINTYDFMHEGKRIDVKTNERIDGKLFIPEKENIDVDIYVLALLDNQSSNIIHLAGYIEKQIIRQQENFYTQPFRKYIMEQNKLKRF